MSERFTIRERRWYSADFIGDEFVDESYSHSRSPIFVEGIRPHGGGKRTFDLQFFHANYPAGVQGKTYTLQTMERGEGFILCRSTGHSSPSRILLIREITWPWLQKHFNAQPRPGENIERWLEENAR